DGGSGSDFGGGGVGGGFCGGGFRGGGGEFWGGGGSRGGLGAQKLKTKVKKISQNLAQTGGQISENVARNYGESLRCLILYGSAASGEYVEGRSNINCLVLLKEVTPDELRKCAAQLPEWHKQGISTPLFVDPAYVRSSVDVFPVEFLDMKQRY